MDLSIYPLPFFLSAFAIIASGLFAWKHRRHGWGLPMGGVLGTVAIWYLGDGLYNDYENYRLTVGDDALIAAWWQVLLFVLTFSLLVRPIHEKINFHYLKRRSYLILFAETNKITNPRLQRQFDHFGKAILVAWLILMAVALYRSGFNFGAVFAPYYEGYKAKIWSRARVGGGISALLSLAGYVQLMLTACFGVLAALATNPKTRMMAIIVCCLAFPYYIFDRTRNPMIATMIPGLLAWTFLRLQGGMWKKVVVLLIAFLMADYWFRVVTETNMGRGISVGDALAQHKKKKKRIADGIETSKKKIKHEGLTMFSELAYMNDFIKQGTYTPTWGGRYFAEAVNVVPRALWKNKPLVGVDYAIARGFGQKGPKTDAGITASIATGMIGQGVVNFGRFLGPMCAALLMSIWVAILARMDLQGEPARLTLYALGMMLTFNMGRDITLFVLYPFVFGYTLLRVWEWQKSQKNME